MKNTIILILIATILSFLVWKLLPILLNRQVGPVQITYWDFWDENSIKPVLDNFEVTYPGIKVTYVFQSPLNYRARVSTQIREGRGPDVFPIHNSWLPLFSGDLSSAPMDIFNLSGFKQTFYPVVSDSFVSSNQIFAAPLGIDGLSLFVNEDILSAGGVSAPKDWEELIANAVKLTVKDNEGIIKTAGVALGTTANIDYWSDILGLMLLQQPGVDLKSPSSEATVRVLDFYTGFVTDPTKKTWDINLPSSTNFFEQGKLAFYFAPYSKVAEIKTANPSLKFKVIPVPQLPGRQIGWASFWGEAVSSKSKHTKESWQLIAFLTSKEIAKVFAKPYARVDLASLQSQDPILGSFVSQGPYYKFWYLSSEGSDQGINDEMIKIWETGVNAVLQGTKPSDALGTISSGTKQVLSKYNVK